MLLCQNIYTNDFNNFIDFMITSEWVFDIPGVTDNY